MSSAFIKPKARSTTTTHTSRSPSREIPYSISELLRSSQIHLERRSLPSLRAAATQSSKPKSPRIDTPLIERPCSSSSTSSFRRSVSGMKELLPFQLQPAPPLPKVDLAAWLDGAVPCGNLQDANPVEYEPIHGSPNSERFTRMRPLPDVQLSDKLQPSRYRETPIYSEPGSPRLGLAYFGDADYCSRCPPPGLFCDELCIVSDYSDAESVEASIEASFINDNEASTSLSAEFQPFGSSLTSFDSPQSSELSIACQGEHVGSNATWRTTGSPSQYEEANVLVIADTSDVFGPLLQPGRVDALIPSNSSRCSSHSNDDEIHNAFTAKVANAKAHVIEIPRTALLSSSSPRSISLCQPHSATSQEQPMTTMEGFQVLHKTSMGKAESQLGQQQNWQTRSPSPHPRLPYDILNPKHSHGEKLEERDAQALGFRDKSSENTFTIIELIRSVVESFPKNMLTLDTSCVVDIRRSARLYTPIPAANRLSTASVCSSDYLATPRKSWRFSLRRSGNRTSCFSAKPPKLVDPEPSGRQFRPFKSGDISGSKEFTAASNTPLPTPPTPDLSSFRKVFPMTSDWWRGFLYAHMVAYNYICEAQAICQFPPFNASGKTLETLGLPKTPSNRLGPSLATSRASLDILRIDLLSCIDQLTSFMLEKSNTLVSTEAARRELKGDEAFVQALAEIVKISENSSAVDVRLAAYR